MIVTSYHLHTDIDLDSIGGACARQLANEGVNLALTYSTHQETLEALVNDLKKTVPHKLHISMHKVDLSSVDQVQNLLKEVKEEHTQPVDILVANAGHGKRIVNVWEIELEQFEHTLNVNLRAPFLLVKGVVEDMKSQKWGRIIFISSIAAYGAGINGCRESSVTALDTYPTDERWYLDYAASKGGLTGMMRNLASRLAEYNISVNDVAPAMIGSTFLIPSAEYVPGILRSIPLGRLGEPQEIANVVTMFAKTGYVTGQSLVAGGGLR